MKKYIIGIDIGTTSCRSVLFDITKNEIIDICSKKINSIYNNKGWVEQDAEEIYKLQMQTFKNILSKIQKDEVIGVGVTNQRETVVAFNKTTKKPIYNAIVWQCRRTTDQINKIPIKYKNIIKQKTGLIPDAYFSATKIKWILQNVPECRKLLKENNLLVGTLDAFFAYKLTGKFVTDTTNASRTMIFNINDLCWDKELLSYFKIPIDILPQVISSSEIVGEILNYKFPLASIIGDQQSSLFGQCCHKKGQLKATYGTGGFVLLNTSQEKIFCDKLITSVAYTINNKTSYCIEGSIYSASSIVNYMKNNLNLFINPNDTSTMSKQIKSSNGVYFIPSFTGMGAPYWISKPGAFICGLTFDTTKKHIVRAGLESISFNTRDIIEKMKNSKIFLNELYVDGGCSKNDFLLQNIADINNIKVIKTNFTEATVLGTIFLTGIACGIYKINQIKNIIKKIKIYKPKINEEERKNLYLGWKQSIKQFIEGDK